MMGSPKWLKYIDAAELMGIKPQTIRSWRSSGREDQPRFYKSGSLVRYKLADVEAWIETTAVTY